jgi:hypothetical protein
MPQPQLFRFFLPLQNPIGFGATDYIALGVAAVFVAAFLLRRQLYLLAHRLAARPVASLVLTGLLPVILRVLLLGHHPIPTPRVADDFSYLLLGDTLAHLRLANAVHPMHRFFEGVFILQDPSYASNFPLGQGLALAIGQLLGNPWFGVVLSVGALCASCYWMLRAWVTPVWALAGGVLAALEFGPLSPWMNTYWGGAVSGVAGCLVFGALPRLTGTHRTRSAILLGAGLGLQMLSRPYEFVLLLLGVALFRIPRHSLLIASLALLPAAGLTLLQNKQVTGSWTELPYTLSRYQYGIPTTFRFQPVPAPHRPLTVEQRIDYETQTETHGRAPAFGERLPFLRFFFLAPLYVALPFFLRWMREPRFWRVLGVIGILWIGTGFYPYFYPHYIAAATCLFVLISVKALESLRRVSEEAALLVALLCLAHFVLWYGIHLTGNQNVELATGRYESRDDLNTGDPEGRIAIKSRLADAAGKQLVFVRYFPQHGAVEWIHNAADIDRARVVWALDLGPDEDAQLRRYYPDRSAWLLEADARPPRLLPY